MINLQAPSHSMLCCLGSPGHSRELLRHSSLHGKQQVTSWHRARQACLQLDGERLVERLRILQQVQEGTADLQAETHTRNALSPGDGACIGSLSAADRPGHNRLTAHCSHGTRCRSQATPLLLPATVAVKVCASLGNR